MRWKIRNAVKNVYRPVGKKRFWHIKWNKVFLNSIDTFSKIISLLFLVYWCDWYKVYLEIFSLFWVESTAEELRSGSQLLIWFCHIFMKIKTNIFHFILKWIFLYIISWRSKNFEPLPNSRGTCLSFYTHDNFVLYEQFIKVFL